MKNLLTIASFVLFNSAISFANVGEEPKINFEKKNDLNYVVNFENGAGKKATIKLTDEKGRVIYEESVVPTKTVTVNLVNPTEGEYKLTVQLADEKLSYEFEID